MAQESGPLTNQAFTDAQWRALVDRTGIIGDLNGTSYGFTFNTTSENATIGSVTQDSVGAVDGSYHRIPANQRHDVVIPKPVSATRTDLLVLRYDPALTGTDPVLLTRIAGAEGGGVPAFDATTPGVKDLPLWEVRRTVAGTTSTVDRRSYTGWPVSVATVDHLVASPLGTRATVGGTTEYVRRRGAQASPEWWRLSTAATLVASATKPQVQVTNSGAAVLLLTASFTAAYPSQPFEASFTGMWQAVANSAGYVWITSNGLQVGLKRRVRNNGNGSSGLVDVSKSVKGVARVGVNSIRVYASADPQGVVPYIYDSQVEIWGWG